MPVAPLALCYCRLQHLRISTTSLATLAVPFRVLQGSVLGLILFLLYTADLLQLIGRHLLHPHVFADDTQIYVTMTVRSCFAALRQIHSVRRSLSRHALLTLIRALVVISVDYCISALAGINGYLMDKLKSVLNAAARLVFSARKYEHITPLLRELHWLRIHEHIQFWLCVLVHRCIHGSAPVRLAESLHQTTEVSGRRCLRAYPKYD